MSFYNYKFSIVVRSTALNECVKGVFRVESYMHCLQYKLCSCLKSVMTDN